MLGYGLLAVAASLWVLFNPEPGPGVFLLNLALLYIFSLPATILHEAGHALGGFLVGWRTRQVIIGWLGKPIWKRTIAGVTWQINSIPLGGMAYVLPRDDRWFRLKASIVYLAGPIINALFIPFAVWPLPSLEQEVMPLVMFGGANLVAFVISIVPYKMRSVSGQLDSDGLLVLRALFRPKELKKQVTIAASVHEAAELRKAARYPEALTLLENLIGKYSNDFVLLSTQALLLMDLGKVEEGRAIYLKLAQQGAENPFYEAVLYNNIAWADLLLNQPDRYSEALAFSEKAYQLFPSMAWIQGTRGAILIMTGRVEEGMALGKSSFENHPAEDPQSKALNACLLAVGERKLGNLEATERWVAIARDLDPKCPLLPRVEEYANTTFTAAGTRKIVAELI